MHNCDKMDAKLGTHSYLDAIMYWVLKELINCFLKNNSLLFSTK